MLFQRFLKFIDTCYASKYIVVKICTELMLKSSGSVVCKNFNFICHDFRLNKYMYNVKDLVLEFYKKVDVKVLE